ncbi:tyrosine-type recombinase/integrase [Prauserella muralis]|uniref:Uncharacterized protein n=1 Tax=Prauserella muralis TaxID=588067 RepID=A0A2V4B069_9PSEU|nr:tyrosine-type recombinase/integrase [Prauserella muralis]PXY27397.1 hypothetical protein BAY60_13260 [Prauserella muralis]TWE22907.1 phage integrase family protein [Prauserella muralis]
MPRPRTPIGTFGEIRVTELPNGKFEARARFRLRNGRMRRLRRSGKSAKAAERALKSAAARLADEVAGQAINGDTRFGHVMDLWLADFEKKVTRGERAPKSLEDYRDSADNHLRPRMGELTCREADNAGLCDEVLKNIRDRVGYAAAKRSKTVLSGICGYAVRHGAMDANPARSVEALEQGEKKPIRALEPEQRRDFLDKLRAWVDREKPSGTGRLGPRARAWADLPDVVEAMLATGVRIGEVLAIVGDDVDPAARTVVADHHLIREKGVGIRRVPLRKGRRQGLTLRVPSWSVPMWRRRKLESGGGPLFRTWNGEWPDPTNVGKRISTACDAIGYEWVTSHIFRHTVATHLGDRGVSDEDIGNQLGNTRDVVEGHYRRKKVDNETIADSLESMFDEPSEGDDDGDAEEVG